MDRDYNLCVLCGRCARICEKIHGREHRLYQPRKGGPHRDCLHKPHTETDCRFCGPASISARPGPSPTGFAKWYGAPDRPRTPPACSAPRLLDPAQTEGRQGDQLRHDGFPEGRPYLRGWTFRVAPILDNPPDLPPTRSGSRTDSSRRATRSPWPKPPRSSTRTRERPSPWSPMLRRPGRRFYLLRKFTARS